MELPLECPEYDCDDHLPTVPSEVLQDLFIERQRLFNEKNGGKEFPWPKGVHSLNLRICIQIKADLALPRLRNQGRVQRWPDIVDLDFRDINDRIKNLGPRLYPLFKGNELILNACPVWNAILDLLAKSKATVNNLGNLGYGLQTILRTMARPG